MNQLPANRSTNGMQARWLNIAAGAALAVMGCTQQDTDPPWEAVQSRGELIVGTINTPTTYFIGRDGPAGPEFELASAFAAANGLRARFELYPSAQEVLHALFDGKIDLAAAGLSESRERNEQFAPGPVYQQEPQQVVCRRGGNKPRGLRSLSAQPLNLQVPVGTSYANSLRAVKVHQTELVWTEVPGTTSNALLQRVWHRDIDCTVARANEVAVSRRIYPELEVAFDFPKSDRLVWYMPREARALRTKLRYWVEGVRRNGELNAVLERYYGHVDPFDYVDVKRFQQRIASHLPKYRPWFEAAARESGLRWTLLAAQAYQESHWNPRAQSATGVRGIMMLTLETAGALGVTDRLDPKPNVFAGAKHLTSLRARLPEEIQEPERTWFALAAYNVGIGHLQDAQALALKLGRNPYSWAEMKTVLPLLEEAEYYSQTQYGYARGNEPVRYVDRVREYEDVLLNALQRSPAPTLAATQSNTETPSAQDQPALSPTAQADDVPDVATQTPAATAVASDTTGNQPSRN